LSVTTQSLTTLEQELKHVKAYLAIEETRFSNKLSVIYDIDEGTLLQNIPPLTLQPLVENAIKHGFKDKEKDCFIRISIKREPIGIMVTIEDNGKGILPERIQQLLSQPLPSETGNGVALYNVNRRLSFVFGDQTALQIQSILPHGTSIQFFIPTGEVNENGSIH
jgi:two-component system sensor histidine kinase LytS